MNPEQAELSPTERDLAQIKSGEYFFNLFAYTQNRLRTYGIEPTQIELVGLKRITERVVEDYKQHLETPYSGIKTTNFPPTEEALQRFFLEFYDVSYSDLHDSKLFKDMDEMREYFKRKQASLHQP